MSYTLGRGKLFFLPFAPNTKTPAGGEMYFGNTPEFGLNVESETLDHFSAEEGVRVKDDSVTLQTNRTGSFITDNIDMQNLKTFFNATLVTVTQSAVAVTDQVLAAVGTAKKGHYYQIGATAGNPAGVRGVGSVTVKKGATLGGATSATLNDDYTLDATLGRIYIPATSTINETTDGLWITYTPTAQSRQQLQVTSGATISGSLRFIAANAKGDNVDYFFPYVTLSPNGDFALKGDEWQQLPFNVEVLKLNDSTASMYIDGRPA